MSSSSWYVITCKCWERNCFEPVLESMKDDKQSMNIRREILSHLKTRCGNDTINIEIGAGTGINVELYPNEVQCIHTLTLDPAPNALIIERAMNRNIEIVHHQLTNEMLKPSLRYPFEDNSVDNVVCSLILCSIDEPIAVIKEIHRILKPGGLLVWIEHGQCEEDDAHNNRCCRSLCWCPSRMFGMGCDIRNQPLNHVQSVNWSKFEYQKDMANISPSRLGNFYWGYCEK